MNGKIVAGFIVITALAAGIAIYWLQEYAFYDKAAFSPGAEIELTTIEGGQPEPILAENLQGIDAESSPIRFRSRPSRIDFSRPAPYTESPTIGCPICAIWTRI